MSVDGLTSAYRVDTGEKVRIPPHWLDHPTLGKPFRRTPKSRAADQAHAGSTSSDPDSGTPAGSDLDTPTSGDGDPAAPTETPAAGD
ncbi:hypothetical protein [Nocardioides soli]|uniref:Uncharacterized protein n=1 Tax=Nocardioides soli TaxID=1036020 RepID=A0A7W4YZR7_9ACTN|nr:hypothetical protein [Nocardioides soli]MBB3041222.1 hypothetical protein [Nocardioides soli]